MKIVLDKTVKTFWKSIPVNLIRDDRLSYEARGVAIHLLSMSNDWDLRATYLPAILKNQNNTSGHLGRAQTRRITRELEKYGYLTRTKHRNVDGTWTWNSTFHPLPSDLGRLPTIDQKAIDQNTVDGSTRAGDVVDISDLNKEVLNKVVIDKEPLQQENNLQSQNQKNDVVVAIEIDVSHPVLFGKTELIISILKHSCESLNAETRQQIIDELTGAITASRYGLRSEIRSVRGWLSAVIIKASKGEFLPEFAHAVRRDRMENERRRIASANESLASIENVGGDFSSKCIEEEMRKIKNLLPKFGRKL